MKFKLICCWVNLRCWFLKRRIASLMKEIDQERYFKALADEQIDKYQKHISRNVLKIVEVRSWAG